MKGAIWIRVAHPVRLCEHRNGSTRTATARVIDFALYVTIDIHLSFVDVNRQLVAAHKIIVLPGPCTPGINRYAAIVMKLRPFAGDVDRTLNFGKWCRAVCLLLAVV